MLNKNEKIVIVVPGYGCHLTDGLKDYLGYVANMAHQHPEAILFCSGAETNRKTAPGITEAELMQDYLRKLGVTNQIMLDTSAISTTENIENTRIFLRSANLTRQPRVIIFCDHARELKIKCIARIILGYWPETYTCELTRDALSFIKQIAVATPLDILATVSPFFRRLQENRRKRIIEAS